MLLPDNFTDTFTFEKLIEVLQTFSEGQEVGLPLWAGNCPLVNAILRLYPSTTSRIAAMPGRDHLLISEKTDTFYMGSQYRNFYLQDVRFVEFVRHVDHELGPVTRERALQICQNIQEETHVAVEL